MKSLRSGGGEDDRELCTVPLAICGKFLQLDGRGVKHVNHMQIIHAK